MDLDVLHQNLPWRNCGPGCVASKFTMEELWTWMCCIKIYHGGIVDLRCVASKFTMEELWTSDVLHLNLPSEELWTSDVLHFDATMEELWTPMCCILMRPWRNCGPRCVAF